MELIPIGIYGRYACLSGASNCYVLRDGAYTAVIDMGSGAFRELMRAVDPSAIDAVILTHLHYDHIADALPYQYYLEHNNVKSVKLYLPSFPANIADLFTNCRYKKRDIEDLGGEPVEVRSYRVRHARNTDSYMLKISSVSKTLLYTSDFSSVDEYAAIAKGADIIIADACVLDEEHSPNSPHASVGSIAAATPSVAKLYLTHLSEGQEEAVLAEARRFHAGAALLKAHEPIEF